MARIGVGSALALALALAGGTVAHGAAAVSLISASGAGDVSVLDALGTLRVVLEHRGGYERGLFPGWIDADRDGCNTRAEVLRRDSRTPVRTRVGGCTVVSGNWVSLYDGLVIDDPSLLEIDHVVSLKEAWDSGAWAWTNDKRAAYANDLSDPRTLRAVSVAANRAKGEKDPSNWLPVPEDQCRYLRDWVAIKIRWGLSADPSELGRVRNVVKARCPGLTLLPSSSKQSRVSPVPFAAAATTTTTARHAGVDVAATVVPVSFRNCAEVRAAGAAPLHRGDPGYRSGLDRDSDGVACE